MFFTVSLLSLAVDLTSKYLAKAFLNGPIVLIPNFIDLTLLFNRGISFGFLSHNSTAGWLLLSLATILVIIFLCLYLFRNLENLNLAQVFAYSLIVGGAVGNAFERIVYREVTDFMQMRFFSQVFFVNNLADDFISIGLIILIYVEVRRFFQGKKR